MGTRFETYKTRSQIQQAIADSAAGIQKVEKQIEDHQTWLDANPGNSAAHTTVRAAIAGMEETLADLKRSHEKYVADSKKPSPAFPYGIAARKPVDEYGYLSADVVQFVNENVLAKFRGHK